MEPLIRDVSETYANGIQAAKGVTLRSSLCPALYGLLALLTVAFASKSAAGQAAAQDKTSEIDAIFDWATPTTPGCVVAVSQNGERVVNRAHGSADLERGIPLTPATIFDAGSLTKQFVAAAVLLLVDDGRIALADNVRNYIPELPDAGYTITVDHLLTHTSGIRDWTGLSRLSSGDEDALTMILRQRGLNFTPGEEWSYSNSGYVLLKELVARTTGMPFSEFARRHLFDPLGMEATTYADELQEGHEHLALAYEKRSDRWEQDMLVGNERGGGGALLSTASDLLVWNEALANARLGTFVTEKLQEPARLNNGRELGYARGLFLDTNRGGRVMWHTGSAGGYKSLLSRYPEQGLSIAILCNAGESANRMMFARRIYDLFVPTTDIADDAATAPGAHADAEGLDVTSRAG
ncbi:MAG: beta-lactamase family protein, partial [Rhodothermaceae bacterium]|nr:beta-lactamase family protein [Rhodothermaceae bacterium]